MDNKVASSSFSSFSNLISTSCPLVINGEKATLETPTFAQKRQRTLDMLIRSLYQDLMPDLHKVRLTTSLQLCRVLSLCILWLSKLSRPCHFSHCSQCCSAVSTAALGLPLHTAPHRLDTTAMLTFSAGLSLLTSLLFLFLLLFSPPLLSLLLLTRLSFHCCCSHPLPGSVSKTPFCFLFPSVCVCVRAC